MSAPMVMPYRGRDVPHAVIEVNERCNISCRACYKDRGHGDRSVEDVRRDIDVALRARRLGVVTLAGGEPTLHPRLPEIVRDAAARGLTVNMLSNGYGVTEDTYARLRDAGLSQVYLHIDSLQKRPDAPPNAREPDLHGLRAELAARVARAGLACALTVTVYQQNLPDLPDVVEFVLHSPHVERLLVTCCTDFDAIAAALEPSAPPPERTRLSNEVVRADDVRELLSTKLKMLPFGYVPSSLPDARARWLFYYAFALANGAAMRVRPCSPRFARIVRLLYGIAHAARGHYPFGERASQASVRLVALGYALTAPDLRMLALLARAATRRQPLLPKSFIFQEGPSVAADGTLQICRDCPDATVRDGRLVPVCLADTAAPDRVALAASIR